MSDWRSKVNTDSVYEYLQGVEGGVTRSQITRDLPLSRAQVARRVEILEEEGKVITRLIGRHNTVWMKDNLPEIIINE